MAMMQVHRRDDNMIAEGDMVIVYEDYQTMSAVHVKAGEWFTGTFCGFAHKKMIGMEFGSELKVRGGVVYLLPPTVELWTECVSHRTQILYHADMSYITVSLDLVPGMRVIEAGTGSGSLSHALARVIGTSGRLFTFEFNEVRAQKAIAEFELHRLSDFVTCRHADVCADEWNYEGIEPRSIDAVVFDLPNPWLAVPKVAPFMKLGGRLCTFSPCIEQIQRARLAAIATRAPALSATAPRRTGHPPPRLARERLPTAPPSPRPPHPQGRSRSCPRTTSRAARSSRCARARTRSRR